MVRSSIAHVVFFISIVSVAAVVAGLIVTETARYAQSVHDDGERDVAEIDAEIELISDSDGDTIYANETESLRLYVKNVGGQTLDPGDVAVLVDGSYAPIANASVLTNDGEGSGATDSPWRVGTVLEVTIEMPLDPGTHRITVDVLGNRDQLQFAHRLAFWSADQADADSCSNGDCTVELDQETLTLSMGTDPAQPDEAVEYAVNNTSVASFADGDDPANETASGTTDQDGEDEVTLDLEATGTVRVSLDTGWDDDELIIRVIE